MYKFSPHCKFYIFISKFIHQYHCHIFEEEQPSKKQILSITSQINTWWAYLVFRVLFLKSQINPCTYIVCQIIAWCTYLIQCNFRNKIYINPLVRAFFFSCQKWMHQLGEKYMYRISPTNHLRCHDWTTVPSTPDHCTIACIPLHFIFEFWLVECPLLDYLCLADKEFSDVIMHLFFP